jgi:molybdopterin synthase sulfur carrier subunit
MAEVTVRLFAAAAEAAGTKETTSRATTLSALRDELVLDRPGLLTVLDRCSFLVDGLLAQGEQDLRDAATVDVLPPFAGG